MKRLRLVVVALDGGLVVANLDAAVRAFEAGNVKSGVLWLACSLMWTASTILSIERCCDEEL